MVVVVGIAATAAAMVARVSRRSLRPQRRTPLTTFRRSPRRQVRLKLHRRRRPNPDSLSMHLAPQAHNVDSARKRKEEFNRWSSFRAAHGAGSFRGRGFIERQALARTHEASCKSRCRP